MTVVLDAEPSGATADPAVMPLERVEAELCTLAGQIAAATSRFLHLLADFDARDGWAGTGVMSCAHWLSWRCGLDLHTAGEHVRTARRLQQLPQIRSAFAQGGSPTPRSVPSFASPHPTTNTTWSTPPCTHPPDT